MSKMFQQIHLSNCSDLPLWAKRSKEYEALLKIYLNCWILIPLYLNTKLGSRARFWLLYNCDRNLVKINIFAKLNKQEKTRKWTQKITIYVVDHYKAKTPLEVNSSDTLADLKKKLCEKCLYASEPYRFMANGKVLNEISTLQGQ